MTPCFEGFPSTRVECHFHDGTSKCQSPNMSLKSRRVQSLVDCKEYRFQLRYEWVQRWLLNSHHLFWDVKDWCLYLHSSCLLVWSSRCFDFHLHVSWQLVCWKKFHDLKEILKRYQCLPQQFPSALFVPDGFTSGTIGLYRKSRRCLWVCLWCVCLCVCDAWVCTDHEILCPFYVFFM